MTGTRFHQIFPILQCGVDYGFFSEFTLSDLLDLGYFPTGQIIQLMRVNQGPITTSLLSYIQGFQKPQKQC